MFTRNRVIMSHNIKTPLTAISRAVGNILQLKSDQLIQPLFSNNEQGFFYDPSDLSTMFQDTAGTIPVKAAGQPVGLMLDKSKGLVLGSELITNGDFSNGTTAWQSVDGFGMPTNTNMTVTNGVMTCAGVNGVKLLQAKNLTVGKWYVLECDVISTAVAIGLYAALNNDLTNGIAFEAQITNTGKRRVYFSATQPLIYVGIRCNVAGTFSVDNFTLKELAGNHAYQTTSSMRPIFEQKPILGANFVTDSTLAEPSKWNTGGVLGVSVSGNKLIFNKVAAYHASVTSTLRTKLTSGKRYLLSYVISGYVSGGVRAQLTGGATLNTTSFNKNGRVSLVVTTTAKHSFVGFQSTVAKTTLNISEVYLQEITGYLTDQNYLQFDGVDDRLVTNLPAQLTGCTVIRSVPNVGTQILTNQTVPTPYNNNIDNCGLIVINRALTPSETSAITAELNKRAGV